MGFEFFISRRYLRTKQKQSFISLITVLSIAGVAIGVMALIIVIAVMAGFETDLKSRILGVEPHLVIEKKQGKFIDGDNVKEKVSAVSGVKSASAFISAQVMLRSDSRLSGALVHGVQPNAISPKGTNWEPKALELVHTKVTQGKPAPAPGIILGKELARSIGVLKGDTIRLISPRGMIAPIGHLPSMKKFRVVGYFDSGIYEYDGSYAFIHLDEARKLMRMPDGITGLEIRLDDIYGAADVGKSIMDSIGIDYIARNWMQMNKNLFSALKLEKTVMFIILALIVLVAALNIAGSLIMMVMEKTKDIAILKTMGANHKNIGKIFIIKGLVIGAMGTVLGTLFGCLLCILLEKYQFIKLPGDVYYITRLPVQLEMVDVGLIAVSAMVICFLATIYPARKASCLNPLDAIRYG
ncbi:MAG: lipoprotein-releasing ABC transporter permease subunit [Desulfobacteraceae bacterium]|nr:lipoprotein-releasing ABC transporter permease subunit [Desulfobacteraceae bacterium]